jgi:hypothetical protein
MIPATYQMPAALFLVLAGVVACFFGYRFFRLVLALFGFIVGALAVTSTIGEASALWLLGGALLGGLLGALLMVGAYFVGVAIIGAALGAMAAHVIGALLIAGASYFVGVAIIGAALGAITRAMTMANGEPGLLLLVVFATVGAVASTYLERYVVMVGTAFGGAWTLMLGLMALAGDTAAVAAASAKNLWVAYPFDFAPDRPWVYVVWVVLGVAGVGVQLRWTGGEKGRIVRRKKE